MLYGLHPQRLMLTQNFLPRLVQQSIPKQFGRLRSRTEHQHKPLRNPLINMQLTLVARLEILGRQTVMLQARPRWYCFICLHAYLDSRCAPYFFFPGSSLFNWAANGHCSRSIKGTIIVSRCPSQTSSVSGSPERKGEYIPLLSSGLPN